MNIIRYIIFVCIFALLRADDCPEGYIDNSANSSTDDDICIPQNFSYNASPMQAYYYIVNVKINNIDVTSDDWVGAFNNGICVGARKWDTSFCGGEVCDIPVLGNDGSEFTEGYMESGQIPNFKIFRASDLTYLDATPDVNHPWSFQVIRMINFFWIENKCSIRTVHINFRSDSKFS